MIAKGHAGFHTALVSFAERREINMQIKIIRHCDPDYSIDSLTKTGWEEAEALADFMENVPVDAYYVSPLGRAQDTANTCLRRVGKTAEVCDWLREFDCPVKKNEPQEFVTDCSWDWLPAEWTARPSFFDKDRWLEEPEFATVGMKTYYQRVCDGLDLLLKKHGYERDGLNYKAVDPNHKVLVFFCHFGLECVLLSHLLNISPMQLWHGTCAAPSSITTVITEERDMGLASWRMLRFGDISHLVLKGMEPSFHARFCECFQDETRH